VEFLNSLLLN